MKYQITKKYGEAGSASNSDLSSSLTHKRRTCHGRSFSYTPPNRKALFYAVYDVSPMAIRYENRLHKVEMRGIMSLWGS